VPVLPKHHIKKSNGVLRTRHRSGPFRVARSHTGLGLFAETPIRKGKFIIEYCGERVLRKYADNLTNKYLFDLNTRWAIDGTVRRNTARYINHSCEPNAIPYEVRGKIRIYAKKNIRPGDEITYDYGREYFDIFLKPIGCKCAACVAKPRRRKKAAGRKHI
jgi:SET domain-containing protein